MAERMKRLLPLLLALALAGCAPMRWIAHPFDAPAEEHLVLMDKCEELPGVELICKLAPPGFPKAVIELHVAYQVVPVDDTVKAARAANNARAKANRHAFILKNTPVFGTVRVIRGARPPGVSGNLWNAISVRK